MNDTSTDSYLQHILAIILIASIFMVTACSDDEAPEQQVRTFIEAGVAAAESRDLSDFSALIADDFRDVNGHDKRNIVRIAAGYFLRNKNIHLFTQINTIQITGEQEADVQMYVAMTGQSVDNISSIFNLRADLYRFDLKLVKRDGDWLLSAARWKRVKRVDVTGA